MVKFPIARIYVMVRRQLVRLCVLNAFKLDYHHIFVFIENQFKTVLPQRESKYFAVLINLPCITSVNANGRSLWFSQGMKFYMKKYETVVIWF